MNDSGRNNNFNVLVSGDKLSVAHFVAEAKSKRQK
jgi:hypothetical protein